MQHSMKNILSNVLKLTLISLLFIGWNQQDVNAQTQARATIIGIPQILPSPYFSDFEQNVFAGNYQVQLNITGPGPVDVRFHVRVTLDNQVLVNETSLPSTFDSGMHILSPFPSFVQFEATTQEILRNLPGDRFRQAFQSGSFPEGNYRITIEPEIVGSSVPGIEGIANFMVRFPQPPTLVSPSNGESIAPTVTTPVFSWSPVMGPPGMMVEYEFLLVELFDGQNPSEAVESNREHASAASVGTTMLPYTASFLPLEEGKTYAWQVTARDVNGEIPINNEGRSEVRVFTYGSVEEEEEEEQVALEEPEFTFEPVETFIPVTTISGTVQYKFRPTEGSQSSQPVNSGTIFYLNPTNNLTVQTAQDDPNYSMEDADYSGNLYTNFANQNLDAEEGDVSINAQVPVYGGGDNGNVEIQNLEQATSDIELDMEEISEDLLNYPLAGVTVKAVVAINGTDHVIATTTANEEGAYTLSFPPSELDRLLSQSGESGSNGNSYTGLNQQDQSQSLSMDAQNANSQGAQIANTELAIAPVKIVVDSPYFTFTEENSVIVSTKNTRMYNAGAMTGTALTYRLNPLVLTHESENQISDAVIEVFRPLDWYDVVPALQPEGFPLTPQQENDQEMINGSMMVKVAEANSADLITRLFPRKKGSSDQYFVRVNARGYNPVVKTLSATPKLTVNESVTIEKIYKLQESLPIVEGRVVRSDNQAPLANVQVLLQAPDTETSGYSISTYFAQTDSDGRFTIADVAVRDEPYNLVVKGASFSEYEEELLLNERGIVRERDPLMVDPNLITVAGKVVNDNGVAVSNARVQWEDGGTPVQSDEHGRFVTANTAGTHTLQFRKIGHRDLDTTITVELSEDWRSEMLENTQNYQQATDWVSTVMNTESFQIASEDGEVEEEAITTNVYSFKGAGYYGYGNVSMEDSDTQTVVTSDDMVITEEELGSAMAFTQNLAGSEGQVSDAGVQDIGTVTMQRRVGKLDVTVQSASNSDPIPDATVEVGTSGLSGDTDDQGSVYFDESPAGTVPLRIIAPGNTNFVPVSTEVTVADNGEVTNVTLSLELGGRAIGTVTAAGNPVEGAAIRLEGRDDISTTSASDGSYVLPGIPTGEWTLKVSKSGFVGVSQSATFAEDQEQTIDFSLQDADFNIAELMGFEIEVDELSTDSDTTLSGAFVSIPSNDLLSVSSRLRIPFSDVQVYEDNGVLKAVEGEVQTDMSEFNATLFDFLEVTITNSNGLIVRQREIISQIGYVAGKVEVDYESTFTGATGWEWPNAADQFLELPNIDDLPEGVGDEELVTLTSDGSFPFPDIGAPDFELNFGSASETIELYGFDITLSLNESVLRNDGFHMNGDITLADIPLLDTATITLQEFWIGTDGTVREASLDLDPEPELQLANWGMKLASGGLSETGFSLGGSVELSIPGSAPSEVTFSDLSISPDQIFGGQFTLPSEGIDVFGIVQLNSNPGTDISFGKVQNEDVYYVTGSAEIDLPEYIDKSLEFREFLVRTDGEFSANIAADFEADFFGLADLTVNGVEFENIGTPSIYVDGQFGLRAIPFITAQAGGITYQPGGSVSVDEIDLDFDVAGVASVGAGIEFVDTAQRRGFTGSGNFQISGTPLDLEIDFFYELLTNSGGLAFGVDVQAGFGPVQLGTVSLSGIGGGFEYATTNSEMEITLVGTISVAPGAEHAIALDPLEVTVEAGNGAPVVTGFAQVSLMTQQIADAELTIDFGKPFFDIQANVGFEKLEDVNITVDGSTRLVLSGEPGDEYWFVGARYTAELLELFDANANILAAWNLDVSSHPEYDDYTDFVPDDYMTGGEINGVHLDVGTEFGIPRDDKECFDFEVGSACAYFYNRTSCRLNADFASANFGFYLGSNWQGGGNVTLLGENIAGADIEASGEILGGYRSSDNVWWADGTADGSVEAYIGDCNVGCSTQLCWPSCGPINCPVPKGASLCVSGSIDVDYSSNPNQGMEVSVEL